PARTSPLFPYTTLFRSTRYGPIGRFDRTNEPVSLVTVVRVAAVAVCVAVISTPGNTAPVRSFAVPLICAVACAQTLPEVKARTRSEEHTSELQSLAYLV